MKYEVEVRPAGRWFWEWFVRVHDEDGHRTGETGLAVVPSLTEGQARLRAENWIRRDIARRAKGHVSKTYVLTEEEVGDDGSKAAGPTARHW